MEGPTAVFENCAEKCRVVQKMGKQGTECVSYGCKKRKRNVKEENYERSDSEGSEDEQSAIKRILPRTFHR